MLFYYRYVTEIHLHLLLSSTACPLPFRNVMEVSDDYVGRFKTTFKEDLASRQENTNNAWLKLATALDPHLKDLKSLPKRDREEVDHTWRHAA